MLELIVKRINDNEDAQFFKREIDKYDIEKAMNDNCVEGEFKNFTDECLVKAFKHVGNRIISDGIPYADIIFTNTQLDITAYNVENVHIKLYFIVATRENEEVELDMTIDTDFEY